VARLGDCFLCPVHFWVVFALQRGWVLCPIYLVENCSSFVVSIFFCFSFLQLVGSIGAEHRGIRLVLRRSAAMRCDRSMQGRRVRVPVRLRVFRKPRGAVIDWHVVIAAASSLRFFRCVSFYPLSSSRCSARLRVCCFFLVSGWQETRRSLVLPVSWPLVCVVGGLWHAPAVLVVSYTRWDCDLEEARPDDLFLSVEKRVGGGAGDRACGFSGWQDGFGDPSYLKYVAVKFFFWERVFLCVGLASVVERYRTTRTICSDCCVPKSARVLNCALVCFLQSIFSRARVSPSTVFVCFGGLFFSLGLGGVRALMNSHTHTHTHTHDYTHTQYTHNQARRQAGRQALPLLFCDARSPIGGFWFGVSPAPCSEWKCCLLRGSHRIAKAVCVAKLEWFLGAMYREDVFLAVPRRRGVWAALVVALPFAVGWVSIHISRLSRLGLLRLGIYPLLRWLALSVAVVPAFECMATFWRCQAHDRASRHCCWVCATVARMTLVKC